MQQCDALLGHSKLMPWSRSLWRGEGLEEGVFYFITLFCNFPLEGEHSIIFCATESVSWRGEVFYFNFFRALTSEFLKFVHYIYTYNAQSTASLAGRHWFSQKQITKLTYGHCVKDGWPEGWSERVSRQMVELCWKSFKYLLNRCFYIYIYIYIYYIYI